MPGSSPRSVSTRCAILGRRSPSWGVPLLVVARNLGHRIPDGREALWTYGRGLHHRGHPRWRTALWHQDRQRGDAAAVSGRPWARPEPYFPTRNPAVSGRKTGTACGAPEDDASSGRGHRPSAAVAEAIPGRAARAGTVELVPGQPVVQLAEPIVTPFRSSKPQPLKNRVVPAGTTRAGAPFPRERSGGPYQLIRSALSRARSRRCAVRGCWCHGRRRRWGELAHSNKDRLQGRCLRLCQLCGT